MLVTFKTPSHADITMFGDVAVPLLKMMGQSGSVPGALMSDDVPAALASLERSLQRQPDPVGESSGADEEDEPPVAVATRAAPLKGLLEAAVESGEHVTWER